MDIDILATSSIAIFLLIFTLVKWVLKGDFFHPAVVYSFVNCGMFLVYTFGPYSYNLKMDYSYSYMYVLIISISILGMAWGEKVGSGRLVKELRVKKTQLSTIYWIVVITTLSISILPFLLSGSGNIFQTSVENRFDNIAARLSEENSNPILFIIQNLRISFFFISTAMISAHTLWNKKKYHRPIILFILGIISAILDNSRTMLLFNANLLLIPIFIILKQRGFISWTKITKFFKTFSWIVIFTFLLAFLTVVLTNARSVSQHDTIENSLNSIEIVFHAKRNPSYYQIAEAFPDSTKNTILQLSLYSGSTVALGGLATNISTKLDIKTWGARSLQPIHRILDRSRLDGGFTRKARNNVDKIRYRGPRALSFGWWGYPANLIVDYGYFGAVLAALVIGWIIGWMYGSISNINTPILKSTGTAIIVNSMLLTPAVNPFGYFPSFLSLSFLIFYLSKKSFKKRKNKMNSYFIINQSDFNKYQ